MRSKFAVLKYDRDNEMVHVWVWGKGKQVISTIEVEEQFAQTMEERAALQWLLDHDVVEYVELVLTGQVEEFVRGNMEHRLER